MHDVNPYGSPLSAEPSMPVGGDGLSWLLLSFEGRVPRRHYWAVSLPNLISFFVLVAIVSAVFGDESSVAPFIFLIVWVLFIWVNLAIRVKRWHDRGEPGYWVFVSLVPLIGGLIAFVQTGWMRGTYGPNEYGADPT